MASKAEKVGWWSKKWKKYVPDKEAQQRYQIAMENNVGPKYTKSGDNYYFEDLSAQGYIPLSRIDQPTTKQTEQVISAVNHLHRLGIVHSDLHVDNIFINPITSDVKFIDFDSCLTGKCNNLTFEEASSEELRKFPYTDEMTGEHQEGPSHFLLGAEQTVQGQFKNDKSLQELYFCKTCHLPIAKRS
jgi:serine/threonine protein kinase